MSVVRSTLVDCSEVWDTLNVGLSSRLQRLQNRAARIIMNLRYNTPGVEAINALGWESLETRRAKSKVKQMYKVHSFRTQKKHNRI
jgi:predicted fused transcriptional regulator/phosphomethylpyrimidine kinase